MKGQQEHDETDVDAVTNSFDDLSIFDLDDTESIIESAEPERSNAQREIETLKTIVVNEPNLEIIKSKLIATHELRCEIFNNLEVNLRLEFPYFFSCPDLVIQ